MSPTKRRLQGANIIAMVFDLLGAVVLALYAVVLGPLGVLRGPIVIERTIWYLWVLSPQGLLVRSVRTAIDWRLGNFDAAIAQLETILSLNEEYFKAHPASRSRKRVLEDLYVVLTRAYLHAGCVDDAMLVVIRAKKCMGIERLGGLAKIDAKTAHLVRAGLAAGRLLDGGGLATMFVKSAPAPESKAPQPAPPPAAQGPRRQGASAELPAPSEPPGPGAKIIPFRATRDEAP
jgi:hypothetical protein